MTINAIHTERHAIALRHPFITALRRVESVEFVRVFITCDHHIGVGEAPPTVAITGESMESIESDIARAADMLVGKSPQEALKLLHLTCKLHGSATAAVDIALHDLLSQEQGSDLFGLLGGSEQPLKTAITISLEGVEMMLQRAAAAREAGYDILKIKVGGKDGADLQRIVSLCKAHADATLLIDANQGWSFEEGRMLLQACADLPIALVEQPLPRDDLEGMQRLCAVSTIPILADESVFTLDDAKKVMAMKAADMINIKLMKCGGIAPAIEIIEWCEREGITCMLGSMLEGPVSIKAAIALARRYPKTLRYLDLDSPLLYRDSAYADMLGYRGNGIFA